MAADAVERIGSGTHALSAERRREIVSEAAKRTGVDAGLLQSLLDLEGEHANLHAWGARPALRRAAASLIDAGILKREDGKAP